VTHCLGIPTIELRRLRSDLTWCYKITVGCFSVTATEFLTRRSTSNTRGHPYKLYKQHSSCTARSSFFTERVVNIFITFRFYLAYKQDGFYNDCILYLFWLYIVFIMIF